MAKKLRKDRREYFLQPVDGIEVTRGGKAIKLPLSKASTAEKKEPRHPKGESSKGGTED